MKFVCRKCESFMLFQEVEPVQEDSLGVTFACPECKAKISMVTNPGETQMVHALGVKLGGRNGHPEPLELTRQTLKDPKTQTSETKTPLATPEGPRAAMDTESLGKCPFANVVSEMRSNFTQPETAIEWTPEAASRLERVPEFVRPFAKKVLEQMAQELGSRRIDDSLMDQAKDKFMSFDPEKDFG